MAARRLQYKNRQGTNETTAARKQPRWTSTAIVKLRVTAQKKNERVHGGVQDAAGVQSTAVVKLQAMSARANECERNEAMQRARRCEVVTSSSCEKWPGDRLGLQGFLQLLEQLL